MAASHFLIYFAARVTMLDDVCDLECNEKNKADGKRGILAILVFGGFLELSDPLKKRKYYTDFMKKCFENN